MPGPPVYVTERATVLPTQSIREITFNEGVSVAVGACTSKHAADASSSAHAPTLCARCRSVSFGRSVTVGTIHGARAIGVIRSSSLRRGEVISACEGEACESDVAASAKSLW